MNIVKLVGYLKDRAKTEKLISEVLPGVEIGLVVIFMENSVCLEGEISFFDDENIPPDTIIEINGIRYQAFFSVKEALEMVEAYDTKYYGNISDVDIAKRMLAYYINDA